MFRPHALALCVILPRFAELALSTLLTASIAGAAESVAPSKDWSADMERFAVADAAKSSVPDSVLFVGSSSIRLWKTLAEDYPEIASVNRGFGGSHISDCIANFDRLVLPHKPRLVVFYAGTNDIASGKSPEDVAAHFREFCRLLHEVRPDAKIAFISIQFAPARWEMRGKMALTNAYVAAFCAADPRRTFVDSNAVTMTPDGQPRPELYVDDQLHMNPAGYAIWAKMMAPVVEAKE